MLRSIPLLAILFAVDWYLYQSVKALSGGKYWPSIVYWGINSLFYGLLFFIGFTHNKLPQKYNYLLLSVVLAVLFSKFLWCIPVLVEDAFLFFWKAYKRMSMYGKPPLDTFPKMNRSEFLNKLGIGLAAISGMGWAYAIVKGKYDYTVRRVKVAIPQLPPEFEGLTITHISDLHLGSFDNKGAVQRGLDLIQAQQSDIIFFTGDLVNDLVEEAQEYKDMLRKLSAKEGIFSVLGNHDYGYYAIRKGKHVYLPAELEGMREMHQYLGWRLMMNENHVLQRGSASIAIVGVENWSVYPYFPQKGNLKDSIQGVEHIPVKILLSHDPSHWEAEILAQSDISLTCSGHTHGCQFGIEIPGIKWSPVQYVYPQWAGLYEKGKRYLYVNRGFGFAALSGRLGIPPEITVLELVKDKHA